VLQNVNYFVLANSQDEVDMKCPRQYCEPDTFPNSVIVVDRPDNINQNNATPSEWTGRSMYVNSFDLNDDINENNEN